MLPEDQREKLEGLLERRRRVAEEAMDDGMESDALAAGWEAARTSRSSQPVTDDGEGGTSQLSPLADVEITFEECELLEMNALCLPSHPQLIYARGTGLARKYPKSAYMYCTVLYCTVLYMPAVVRSGVRATESVCHGRDTY